VIQVDNILQNILINLADMYPQAPPSGGTPRLREVITQVNRVDDAQNDFIYTSSIKISDYIDIEIQKDQKGKDIEVLKLKESEDYTSFIMEVINSAIQVAQDNKDDSKERTTFEIFTEFSRNLFWLAEQKQYQEIVSGIELKNKSQHYVDKNLKENEIDCICTYFSNIFDSR
jgi:hypothetical protein